MFLKKNSLYAAIAAILCASSVHSANAQVLESFSEQSSSVPTITEAQREALAKSLAETFHPKFVTPGNCAVSWKDISGDGLRDRNGDLLVVRVYYRTPDELAYQSVPGDLNFIDFTSYGRAQSFYEAIVIIITSDVRCGAPDKYRFWKNKGFYTEQDYLRLMLMLTQ